MRKITVQVPASASNLGPGYDCLGVALQLYNRVTVARSAAKATVHPMAAQAAEAYFRASGGEAFAFDWSIEGDVPASRGLGSSVTLRLGLLHGLNVLAGKMLAPNAIFELAAELEGHPDNAAPAQYGGFTVAGGGPVLRFPVDPKLRFVLFIPDFEIRTEEARAILPATVDRQTAVASAGRACRITAAFASGDYESLDAADAFDDLAFHQSHRLPFIPFLPTVLQAARAAGAIGGFLSGSGSTIAALTFHKPKTVAAAMQAAAGGGGHTVVTRADNHGVRIDKTSR